MLLVQTGIKQQSINYVYRDLNLIYIFITSVKLCIKCYKILTSGLKLLDPLSIGIKSTQKLSCLMSLQSKTAAALNYSVLLLSERFFATHHKIFRAVSLWQVTHNLHQAFTKLQGELVRWLKQTNKTGSLIFTLLSLIKCYSILFY